MSATIYTTFIERESCFIKIWGQKEKNISMFIENSLMQMKPQFEAGVGMLQLDQIHTDLLCCAKFKDNSYYRARITSVAMLQQGMVEVLFIDYGNRDLIQLANIRTINNFPTSVIALPPQANDFILAQVQVSITFPPDSRFEMISDEIRYLDFEYKYVGQVGPYSLLSLFAAGRDIAESFIARQFALPIEISMQLMMLQNILKISPLGLPGVVQQQPAVMMAQRSPSIPMNPSQTSPGAGGQPDLLTFKSLPLKVGSEHTVYVSYVNDGPCLFSIQLQHKEQELQELMFELNKLKLVPIEENILPGCVCLARSSEDNYSYICRAVVTNMVENNYKVFFVDFGNTEVRSYDDIFQIPFKYVIPKVMATRFALNGLQGQVVSVDMKVAFKSFVDNTALKMRVCAPFPKTGVSLCELYNTNGVSALDFVRGVSLQGYPETVSLTRGFNQEVKVSYVFSCVKFYVQLRKKEDELNKMMQELQTAQMQPITQDLLKINAPCIALYAADGMYYRAQILSVEGNSVVVKYVDYGNEEHIPIKDIRSPMMEFITNLRPQAIECCLNGYQNMETDQERDNLLEELMLEQYFSMKVADVQGSRILVDLFDAQLYNVASLLLDKMAKTRSQVSPALVQDNKIDHRKTTPNKYSPRDNKTDSWRDKERPQRQASNDWRQNKELHQNSFEKEDNAEYRKKIHSNTWGDKNNRNSGDGESKPYQDRRKPQNWTDRPPKRFEDKSNEWADGDKPRSESKWNDNKRQNNWGGGDGRENSRENSWGDKREQNDNTWNGNRRERPERDFKKRPPRDDSSSWGGSGSERANSSPRRRRDNRSEEGSEKSFSSGKSFKGKRDNFGGSPPKKNVDENVDYADSNVQYTRLSLIGTEHKVSVSWFYNPTSFFVQPVDDKAKFDSMMKDIQFAYIKRKVLESAEVGNTVIAQFPEDKAFYRAIIVEKPLTGTYKVLYVDFGNTALTNKIYKVEKRFLELPAQAVHCGLVNVHPVGAEWPKADDFGRFFGEDIIDCKFVNASDNLYSVEISTKGKSLVNELQTAGLAVVRIPYEHFDINYLLSQQICCKLNTVHALDDFTLEILPGLIVSCAIFKHELATTPNLDLMKTFVNQKIIVFVDDVQNNKLIVTLYNSKGQFIPAIELQEEMFEVVNPVCQALIIGPCISGYVPHATPSSVFIQLDYTAKNVDLLLEQLFQRYETSEYAELEVKEIFYAVKSSDGNWYRGLMKNIKENEITVQFVDYGNEEIVDKTSLRLLTEDFFIPCLAAEISLKESEQFLDQEVKLKVVFGEDAWIGEVMQPTQQQLPQNDTIPTEQHVETEQVSIPEETTHDIVQEESPLSPIGFSVVLSHFDNPGQFYLQQSSALEAIAQLKNDLQPQIETLTDLENITTGIICAAPYSADQVWYRAQVLDADAEITTVRFIDYGNTDVLGTDIKIKSLPAELLSLEEHAKRCSLHLSPVNGEWTSEACKRFEDITSAGVQLTAEIVHQDEITTFVRLYANNTCVDDIFINEGYATELKAPQAAFKGFVSNLNSPSEFWLQFEHACNDLEWIADQLVNADKFKLLEDQAPGSLCAAIFPEDDSWYRARILSNTVAGVEVLFIDYGNSCTCTSLHELPEDLVMVPPLAHKCSLLKPPGLLEWSSKATDKFKEISADGVTVFTVIKHAQGETNQVQLILNEEDITQILKPELFEAKMLSCNSLNEFSLRRTDLEDKFTEVQGKIQELGDKPCADETIVAGLYENVFYRAKINGAIVDKYVVDLLDLGIEADVTELRQLPKDLVELEPLSMTVKMNPLVGYAFNAESETYFKTLCETETLFHVELVTDKIVRLYLNGCDVRDKMPSTKCTPLSSVHSTPKKVKIEDVIEVKDEDSSILLSKTVTEAENIEEQINTVEIAVVTEKTSDIDEVNIEKVEKGEIKGVEKGLSLEDELKQAENKMAAEIEDSNITVDVKTEKEEKETISSVNTSNDEELLKDAEMFVSVTDELVEKVAKQCNLIDDVNSNKEETVINGKHETKTEGKETNEENGGETSSVTSS